MITARYGSSHLVVAALRLADGLWLSVPHRVPDGDTEELVLALWQTGTAAVSFEFLSRTLRFRLLPAGAAFTALAALKIHDARVDSRELEHALSSSCRGLKELALDYVSLREGNAAVLSIHFVSLQRRRIRRPAPGRHAGVPGDE